MQNPLERYLSSLSISDKDLIKDFHKNDIEKLIDLDHVEFDQLIKDYFSFDFRELSEEQLQRRDEIVIEIKKNRARSILQKSAQEQEEIKQNVDTILQKVGLANLDNLVRAQLENCVVVGVYSYDGPLLALADSEKKVILRAEIKTEKKKNHDHEDIAIQQIEFKEIIFNCCPIDLTVNHDEITNAIKYIITFVSPISDDRFFIGPLTHEELLLELKRRGFVHHGRLAEDAINIILNAFKTTGKAKYTSEIEKAGFFLTKDGVIKCNNRQFKKPEISDAASTCEFLNLLPKQWRTGVFATVLKFVVIAPFAFALKQHNSKNNTTKKWLPILFLFGERDSGKNVLASIAEYTWELDHDKFEIPASGASTETRFGEAASTWTYPVFVDEIEKLFDTNPQMLSIVKTAVQNKTVRIVYSKNRDKIEVPAFASFIFSSNPEPPLDDDSASKRFSCIRFTKEDIKSAKAQEEFDKDVLPNMTKLSALGNFVAEYIAKNPEILFTNEKWHETATDILKEFFNYSGKEKPAWLDEFIAEDRYLENAEEKIARIRSHMVNTINNAVSRMSVKFLTVLSTRERIKNCCENDLVPWLDYKVEDMEIIIRKEIIQEIRDKCKINNLKLLAETLEWEYKRQFWLKESKENISCIIVSFDKFADFLASENMKYKEEETKKMIEEEQQQPSIIAN